METGRRTEYTAWEKMHERINEIYDECKRVAGTPSLPNHLKGRSHSSNIINQIAAIKMVKTHTAKDLLRKELNSFSPEQLKKYLEYLKK